MFTILDYTLILIRNWKQTFAESQKHFCRTWFKPTYWTDLMCLEMREVRPGEAIFLKVPYPVLTQETDWDSDSAQDSQFHSRFLLTRV